MHHPIVRRIGFFICLAVLAAFFLNPVPVFTSRRFLMKPVKEVLQSRYHFDKGHILELHNEQATEDAINFSLPKEVNEGVEIFSRESLGPERFPNQTNNKPIVFFNDFLKKINEVDISIGNVPKKSQSKNFYIKRNVDNLHIIVSEDFTYIDLPSLVLAIRDNSDSKAEITEDIKVIAEKYKDGALHLIGILKSGDWKVSPKLNPCQKQFTKKVQKKMLNQAFTYFQCFRAFSGEDIHKRQNNTTAFVEFYSKTNTGSKSQRDSGTNRRLKMLRFGIDEETGCFETEFLEVLALDSDIIDCFEEEKVVNLINREIEKSFSFHEKILLSREIEKWREKKRESIIEHDRIKSLKRLVQRLDSIYQTLNHIRLFKDAEKELEISEAMFGEALQGSLRQSLESSIVTRGIQNIQEVSGLKEIFESKFLFVYRKLFPGKAENLRETSERYNALKARCEYSPNDVTVKKEFSVLQEEIGKVFLEMIFSGEFLNFTNGSYSLSSISRSQAGDGQRFYSVNCMLVGSLLYAMWEVFFDEKLLAVASDCHFSMAIKNPKGEIVSFDEIVKKTDLKDKEGVQYPRNYRVEKERFAMVGDFKKMYVAAVLNTMGMLESEQGNFERAEFAVTSALEKIPENPNYWAMLAEIYKSWSKSLKKNNSEESEKIEEEMENCYKKAISLDKINYEYLVNLGNYYMRKGRLQDAKIILNRALEINSNNINVLISNGYLYYLLGKEEKSEKNAMKFFDNALEFYSTAVAIEPIGQNAIFAFSNIAIVQEAKGNEAEHKKAVAFVNVLKRISD